MESLPSFSHTAKRTRAATPLLAALLWAGASLHTAGAADALSTSTGANFGRGRLGGLIHKDTADKYAAPHGGSNRLNRSILALPLGIFRGIGSGFSHAVNAAKKL
jgi:hypothetical protein